MTKTQYIFSYGTLHDEKVQRAIFGRKLTGKSDTLRGFSLSEAKIMGQYPVIFRTGNPADSVAGKIYNISNLELHKTDAYETNAYKRISVELLSGIEAWAYVENSG